MSRQSTAAVATLGIDIGKNVFHLIGLNERGAIILRQKLSRRQLETRLTNMVPCLIGMEASVGSHHLGRQLKAHGHDVRLMPATGSDAGHLRPWCMPTPWGRIKVTLASPTIRHPRHRSF